MQCHDSSNCFPYDSSNCLPYDSSTDLCHCRHLSQRKNQTSKANSTLQKEDHCQSCCNFHDTIPSKVDDPHPFNSSTHIDIQSCHSCYPYHGSNEVHSYNSYYDQTSETYIQAEQCIKKEPTYRSSHPHRPPCSHTTNDGRSKTGNSNQVHVENQITTNYENKDAESYYPSFIMEEDMEKRKRKCCHRSRVSRACVIFAFIFIALGSIAAFFCWPRTPLVTMGNAIVSGDDPTSWGIEQRPSLRSTWLVNVTFDNNQNWIPTHLTKLGFNMMDSLTFRQFAWGVHGPMVFQPRKITSFQLKLTVDYSVASAIDPTYQNLYKACGTQKNGENPSLNVILHMDFHFFGFMWVPTLSITPPTGGFLCPLNG
ncbi:hypothetical protein BDF14DRAFT_1755381 [Spinellus fusiger]|nr:hypothetical protein BDF14DRAFT_1755381 [Spinellus fusiger]